MCASILLAQSLSAIIPILGVAHHHPGFEERAALAAFDDAARSLTPNASSAPAPHHHSASERHHHPDRAPESPRQPDDEAVIDELIDALDLRHASLAKALPGRPEPLGAVTAAREVHRALAGVFASSPAPDSLFRPPRSFAG